MLPLLGFLLELSLPTFATEEEEAFKDVAGKTEPEAEEEKTSC